MKTEKRETMHDQIRKHGEDLLRIFPGATKRDPIDLCKALRRIETRGQRLAEGYCNGYHDSERHETYMDKVLEEADRLLRFSDRGVPVFTNSDPRGYCLKIDDTWMREHNASLCRDWGGYGIICPDFTPTK
jgi:hypothetical protein